MLLLPALDLARAADVAADCGKDFLPDLAQQFPALVRELPEYLVEAVGQLVQRYFLHYESAFRMISNSFFQVSRVWAHSTS
ncbi:hypothetical protein SDC9_187362 [bioreactor metagenome]|uniref:Uncharacterized protein n=1 Tax=bioreactor metagenome TaxID=1076179 RepID=A0A645HLE3_9ZZZZ